MTKLDYAILCAVDLEFAALTEEFENEVHLGESSPVNLGILKSKRYVMTNSLDQNLAVSIYMLPRQGCLSAAISTCELIREKEQIGTICSFGIAGTLDSSELAIGDVIIPNAVYYYEPWREQAGPLANRVIPFSPNLNANTMVQVRSACEDQEFEVICDRGLASGEKLIADVNSRVRKRINGINQHIYSVEMEAAGVIAPRDWLTQGNGTNIIIIKGISDPADKRKSGKSKSKIKEDRALAARNAAKVLHIYLRHSASTISNTAQVVNRYRNHTALKTSQEFIGSVPSQVIHEPLDPLRLARVQHIALSCRAPIFYHWEQSRPFLNLVEYIYISILTNLKALGHTIYFLVTDLNLTDDTKNTLAESIKYISGVSPNYYSDNSSRLQLEINEHVSGDSMTDQLSVQIDQVIGTSDSPNHDSKVMATRFWNAFIPWASTTNSDSPSSIIFSWHKNADIYKYIQRTYTRHRNYVLSTNDIILGGQLSKFGEDNKKIAVIPESAEETRESILRLEDFSVNKDVKGYISMLRGLSQISSIQREWLNDLDGSL